MTEIEAKKQVDSDYYAQPKYANMERFISYFLQIKFLRDLKGKKVLLIGVGDGLVPYYLRNVLGVQVITLDIDPDLKPDVVGDLRSLPFRNDEFDAAVAYEVLEHLPFEDLDKILSELSRVSSGRVIVSLPHRHTGFDMVFKFPFIRSLTGRDFIRLNISTPIKFPGFAVSKQHYWEIERDKTRLKDVRKKLLRYFHIVKEERAVLDAYRHFFVMQNKKKKLENTFVRDYYNNFLQALDVAYTTRRWHGTPANVLDFNQTKQAIKKVLPRHKKEAVLEIGPGDGAWTPEILPLAKKLVLLDQSEGMLKRAQERLKNYEFLEYIQSDFLEFQKGPEFDLIFAIRCFEYFDDQRKALQKMNSLLKKGGQVIMVTKNRNFVSFKEIRGKLLHSRMRTKPEIKKMFEEAGFELTKSFSATLRVKAKYKISRVIFSILHKLHVSTFGFFTIPWLFDKLTESYVYVAEKK